MMPLAEGFSALAEQVERGEPTANITQALSDLTDACHRQAKGEAAGPRREDLMHVQEALRAWAHVWARLGGQAEFRAAVAREARLWSRRLA